MNHYQESNRTPKVMLETHYLFQPEWSWVNRLLKENENDRTKWGIGPFLAIEPGQSGGQVIGAYSLGILLGLKRGKSDDSPKSSWNIGVGYMVNTGVKTLGDGLEEGQPLPVGEKEVRYKETNQPGWLIMASFSW